MVTDRHDDLETAGAAETSQADVLEFIELAKTLGATIWLDGGWGVDACLGQQTRRHADLDLVLEARHLDVVVTELRSRGYSDVKRGDSRAWNFVLADTQRRQVDFHVSVFDEQGNGIFGPAENGQKYPADALEGLGSVGGRTVRCITPEWLVAFHTGYAVSDKDWSDVSLLCERFGIAVPPDYRRWETVQR